MMIFRRTVLALIATLILVYVLRSVGMIGFLPTFVRRAMYAGDGPSYLITAIFFLMFAYLFVSVKQHERL